MLSRVTADSMKSNKVQAQGDCSDLDAPAPEDQVLRHVVANSEGATEQHPT